MVLKLVVRLICTLIFLVCCLLSGWQLEKSWDSIKWVPYKIRAWQHPIKIWVDFTVYPSNHFSGCRLNGRLCQHRELPIYVHSEVFYEQGPPWQSGFLRLTLTGRKMQITILFEGGSEILRLYIFRGYTQFLWNAYWASAFASDITHYQFWGFSFTFWVWICNILILWENLWNCNA